MAHATREQFETAIANFRRQAAFHILEAKLHQPGDWRIAADQRLAVKFEASAVALEQQMNDLQ